MSHDGRDKSKSPITIVDNAGVQQNIKVVEIGDASNPVVAGYSYIEATGSTLVAISDTQQHLSDILDVTNDISSSLLPIAENISYSINDISSSIIPQIDSIANTASLSHELLSSSDENLSNILDKITDISASVAGSDADLAQAVLDASASVASSNSYISQSTDHVQQLLKLNRATNVYSKVFNINSLYDGDDEPVKIDLHMDTTLNPAAPDVIFAENYISKATEVMIQNSTNRSVFLKISYDPSLNISNSDYSIKIPPGVIYNSEEKIAHIRHKIVVAAPKEDMHGEVAASIIYNTGLNHDLTIGQTFTGTATLTSLATNVYNIVFGTPKLISEWYFNAGLIYDSLKVSGQARITNPGQKIKLYIERKDGTRINDSGWIDSITPTEFTITVTGVGTDYYELKAETDGVGSIGDAVVLYADLIKYKNE